MTSSLPVLSRRAINRAVLARQSLLERAVMPLPQMVTQMGFLQAQYAPSMYVGLASRVHGVRREDITAALENRSLVQGTLLRGTIHLVARDDYWPVAEAIRQPLRSWFLRTTKQGEREQQGAADKLRSEFERSAVLTRKDIERVVAPTRINGVMFWLELVRVPPSGTWDRRRADRFALAQHWIGASTTTPEEGAQLVVRRFLAAFGPAPRRSIAAWSGIPAASVDRALEALQTREFTDEEGNRLVDLAEGHLPDAGTPAPVRFLPHWDAVLLAFARYTGVLPEDYRPAVFTSKNPQSVATFTVDGAVAGTWRYDGERVVTTEFAPLRPKARREVRQEAERVAEMFR